MKGRTKKQSKHQFSIPAGKKFFRSLSKSIVNAAVAVGVVSLVRLLFSLSAAVCVCVLCVCTVCMLCVCACLPLYRNIVVIVVPKNN